MRDGTVVAPFLLQWIWFDPCCSQTQKRTSQEERKPRRTKPPKSWTCEITSMSWQPGHYRASTQSSAPRQDRARPGWLCTLCVSTWWQKGQVSNGVRRVTLCNALSAALLIIAYFVFQTDARNVKDSMPFLSLVPLSGTISLSLCDMLQLCLPSSHSSRLTFSLSLTPNTSHCLQPASRKCVCMYGWTASTSQWAPAYVCMCVCGHVWVCELGMGGRCLMTNLCMLLLFGFWFVF